MNAHAPTHEEVFCETLNRYWHTFGLFPQFLRANVCFGRKLADEGSGFHVVEPTAKTPHLRDDEVMFRGVIIRCDLPTTVPTVVARYPFNT